MDLVRFWTCASISPTYISTVLYTSRHIKFVISARIWLMNHILENSFLHDFLNTQMSTIVSQDEFKCHTEKFQACLYLTKVLYPWFNFWSFSSWAFAGKQICYAVIPRQYLVSNCIFFKKKIFGNTHLYLKRLMCEFQDPLRSMIHLPLVSSKSPTSPWMWDSIRHSEMQHIYPVIVSYIGYN